MKVAVRRAVIAFVAILFAELVWVATVPPFRGSDEIDHVYRAAGVASGQIHLTEGTTHGRGILVWVPTDIVDAAQKQCLSLSYLLHDNCHAAQVSGDRSLVATSAAGYDPMFYAVVGTVAKPFHGAAADYAMRVTTAVWCAVLLAIGVGALSFAGGGRWTTLGVFAALTPEVLFSGAIPSPNGVEMGLAFVLWAALLAAVRTRDDPVVRGRLLALAGIAAFPLTFVRLLGPLWVVLIVGSVVAVAGLRATWDLVRAHRRVVGAAAVATLLGVFWWHEWQVIASRTTGGVADSDVKHWILAFNLPAFLLQMVGAFPFRDEPLPVWVYPLPFLVIGAMLWLAARRAPERRIRRTVVWLVVVTLVVPVVLSLYFMPSAGAIWQGRYEIPFVIGILPLCGLALDDAGFAPVEGARLIGLACAALVTAQVASVVHVERLELVRWQSVTDPAWWHPPPVVYGVLIALACGIAGLLLHEAETTADEPVLADAALRS